MSKIRSKAIELGGSGTGSWSRRLATALGNDDFSIPGSWNKKALGGVDHVGVSGSWKTKLKAAILEGQIGVQDPVERLTESGVVRLSEDGTERVLERF